MARRRKTTAGRGSPEASRRRGFPGLSVLLAIAGLALVGWFVVSGLLSGGQGGESGSPAGPEWPPPGPKSAAIVDQLSLTQPNPDFVASARSLLAQAGYDVDFYRNLPAHDYDLVILRVHSGRFVEEDAATGEEELEPFVSLFTGEPYNTTKYRED